MPSVIRTVQPLTSSYRVYVDSFVRHLRAENRSERTCQTYAEAVVQLDRFCDEKGMPTDPLSVTREHIEEFINHLPSTKKPSTANNRFRSLAVFFRWLRATLATYATRPTP